MEDKPLVEVEDLGLIAYAKAWEYQQQLHKLLIDHKRSYRDISSKERPKQRHKFLFCEHHPVLTLGKSGKESHLLTSEEGLRAEGVEFFRINRGGDITFHGPGQLVGYPIFDLDEFFTDVHQYVRYIEQAIMSTLTDYGLHSLRIPGYTGVWLPGEGDRPARKICAIGVHLSRWVTMHGFALNVNTQLQYFQHIIPCGISEVNMEVTSLAKEIGREVSLNEVKSLVLRHFASTFGFHHVAKKPCL